MGSALVERSPAARQTFDEASAILGFDLLKLCTDGPIEELNRTEYSQPALFVHSMAALRQLEAERPTLWESVTHTAGLSLGEYTAVAAGGGFSFPDGLRLVQARGQAMQAAADAVPSGMTSVLGMEQEPLAAICQQASSGAHDVRLANLLCPGNIAISGHLSALEAAEKLCLEAGAMRTIRLSVAGAFHTPIMQPAVQALEGALASIDFSTTRVPIISNVDAAAHISPAEIKRLLAQQVVSPVRWEDSLRNLIDAGVDHFIEVGTGRILAGTLKRINRKILCEHFGDA